MWFVLFLLVVLAIFIYCVPWSRIFGELVQTYYEDVYRPRARTPRMHRHVRRVYAESKDEWSEANEKRAHEVIDKIGELGLTEREMELLWSEAKNANRHACDMMGVPAVLSWDEMCKDSYVHASLMTWPRLLVVYAHDPGFVRWCDEAEEALYEEALYGDELKPPDTENNRDFAEMLAMARRIHSEPLGRRSPDLKDE
jgi:hypothetical protein